MTKKEVFKGALERIESGKDLFMCNAIERVAGCHKAAFKEFPEILKFKPKDKGNASAWWYADEEGKQNRIRVLKTLIEECEND